MKLPLPKGFNMHRINDFLMSKDSGLTHAQKVIAYHCIHLDYGRKKGGKFWKGAVAVGEDSGTDRKTVLRTWEIMCQKGWITDTTERKGRAKVWRIEYRTLWNDSQLCGNDSHLDEDVDGNGSQSKGNESPAVRNDSQSKGNGSHLNGTESRPMGNDSRLIVHSVPTNPLKESAEEASEVNSQNEFTEEAAKESVVSPSGSVPKSSSLGEPTTPKLSSVEEQSRAKAQVQEELELDDEAERWYLDNRREVA